ncbi:MAG: PEP-CTERM sorting domain-containing protein [Deltaproteobacteria bacterium]|nr:PEP-CTERM sorting domain-containing protein [Deltaproteobacteria bacterium]
MRRKKTMFILILFLSSLLSTNALADILTIDIWAWIPSGNIADEILYIDDNTLQWNYPGATDTNGQITISTWLNGTQVLNNVNWYPNWSSSPWSDVFNGLNPAFPNEAMNIVFQPLFSASGNLNDMGVRQMPTSSNGYEIGIGFSNAHGWSRFQIDATYPVPEPGTLLLLGMGLTGLLGVRRIFK